MALVQLVNTFTPDVWDRFFTTQTMQANAFYSAGIVAGNPLFDALLAGPGDTFDLPFYNDLDDGEANTSSDDAPGVDDSVPALITTGKEIGIRITRNKSWSAADLVQSLSGSDPFTAIGQAIGRYWSRQDQLMLIACIQGFMADNRANDSADMYVDKTIGGGTVTAANLISADAVVDALQSLGDAQDQITGMIVHSTVAAEMKKQNLISFIPPARGEIAFTSYLGRTLVIDDGMPTETDSPNTEYSTYLFGNGMFNDGNGSAKVPVEADRAPASGKGAGSETIYHRREQILAPRGFEFTSSSLAKRSPTNAELATEANWNRVYAERKQIPFVELRTNG